MFVKSFLFGGDNNTKFSRLVLSNFKRVNGSKRMMRDTFVNREYSSINVVNIFGNTLVRGNRKISNSLNVRAEIESQFSLTNFTLYKVITCKERI